MQKVIGRRGIAFAVDALFAIAVIAVFAISVVPTYSSLASQDSAASKALSTQSADALRAMCLATVGELSATPEIAALYSDGNLTANDSEMTLCQLVARLEAEGGRSVLRAGNVTAEVFGPLVPETTRLAVYAGGTLVYNTTSEPASPKAMHASSVYVYSYGKQGIAANPIGPVRMEARMWWP